MSVQVLIATMNQNDHKLLDKMNIQTDSIVGNQCDRNCVEYLEYHGLYATYLNFAERGVGLNRNNALMRATADICLFADDDMVYVEGYGKLIEDAFKEHPEADILVFNIIGRNHIIKYHRVGYLNYLRYGTARIAIRLNSVKNKGIYFNQCFGGGTDHCHGEDNLFLCECLNKGLKIYAIPLLLAKLKDGRASTWNFEDMNKYLVDQGCLYKTISKRWWVLLCLQDAVRHHRRYGLSIIDSMKKMVD